MRRMNRKHRKTLEAIFSKPVDGALEWSRIESVLLAVDCRVIETVTFEKNGIRAYFHRPYPRKEALRYRVEAAREFLAAIGVTP